MTPAVAFVQVTALAAAGANRGGCVGYPCTDLYPIIAIQC